LVIVVFLYGRAQVGSVPHVEPHVPNEAQVGWHDHPQVCAQVAWQVSPLQVEHVWTQDAGHVA